MFSVNLYVYVARVNPCTCEHVVGLVEHSLRPAHFSWSSVLGVPSAGVKVEVLCESPRSLLPDWELVWVPDLGASALTNSAQDLPPISSSSAYPLTMKKYLEK